jgi:hypothetical protein
MPRADLAALFLLSLAVRLAAAALISRPGYMDAAYYAVGAGRLASGGGLSETFLWHYLDDPPGLPHAGFLYWMPLPSLLGAPLAALFPGSFFALQIPFALLSALLPPLAYGLAWQVSSRRWSGWLAGLLMLWSGFFFPYWTLPETFAPFALAGSLALWLAGSPPLVDRWRESGRWLLVGALVGLAHLTRADGFLLLPVVALAPLLSPRRRSAQHATRNPYHVSHLASVALGYLLVMAPWLLRNLALIGAPLSPAGARTLWLTDYNDLFCYGCDLSPRAYLAWGWPNILTSKLQAGWVNLQRFLAENCLVFMLPFVLAGLYRLRRQAPFALAAIYLLLVYLTHSLAFTFPGPRGGFFHASSAAMPFLTAAGVEALEAGIGWAARRRRWNAQQARVVLGAGAALLALLLSLYVGLPRLADWRQADELYRQAGAWLDGQDVPSEAVVMVGNPPAFVYHCGRPAVVVPNGGVADLLEVAARYGVAYVLLDANHPPALGPFYRGEESSPRLQVVARWADGVLYRLTE